MTDIERINLFSERLHKVWKESGLSKGHLPNLQAFTEIPYIVFLLINQYQMV